MNLTTQSSDKTENTWSYTSLMLLHCTLLYFTHYALKWIATRYGLDCLGIETQCGRDFPQRSRPASGPHPASCTMGTGSFPEVKWLGLWH